MQDNDLTRLAQLAQLRLSDDERPALLAQLNGFFDLVQQMQSVDTQGVAPLAHPLDAWGGQPAMQARLRDDATMPESDMDLRAHAQTQAPQMQDGLYLVPRVVE